MVIVVYVDGIAFERPAPALATPEEYLDAALELRLDETAGAPVCDNMLYMDGSSIMDVTGDVIMDMAVS